MSIGPCADVNSPYKRNAELTQWAGPSISIITLRILIKKLSSCRCRHIWLPLLPTKVGTATRLLIYWIPAGGVYYASIPSVSFQAIHMFWIPASCFIPPLECMVARHIVTKRRPVTARLLQLDIEKLAAAKDDFGAMKRDDIWYVMLVPASPCRMVLYLVGVLMVMAGESVLIN